ncbi:MAG TPA: hypothetical protein VFV39_01060, partial [Limnobacter sp.]|nr:hypothetical protein [Limnobacter sp.]
AFPEMLGWLMHAETLTRNGSLFFNAWYGLTIAIVSYVWAFVDTHAQFKQHDLNKVEPIELLTVNVYPSDHSFEDKQKQRPLLPFVLAWALIGIVMLSILPGPIRRLNLRVFNRHVEAYERFQQSQKRKASQ